MLPHAFCNSSQSARDRSSLFSSSISVQQSPPVAGSARYSSYNWSLVMNVFWVKSSFERVLRLVEDDDDDAHVITTADQSSLCVWLTHMFPIAALADFNLLCFSNMIQMRMRMAKPTLGRCWRKAGHFSHTLSFGLWPACTFSCWRFAAFMSASAGLTSDLHLYVC